MNPDEILEYLESQKRDDLVTIYKAEQKRLRDQIDGLRAEIRTLAEKLQEIKRIAK